MRKGLIILTSTVTCICGGFAQPHTGPTFEVASVKLNTSGDFRSSTNSSTGELFIRNSTLKSIIQSAYDVREYSFSGPDWLATVRFDVSAKLPPSDSAQTSREERQFRRRQMLQNFLADRFKLETHRETRTLPGYALVVGRKAPKLAVSERKDGTSISTNNGSLNGSGMTMASLANMVAIELRSPVADMTGVEGRYDIKLEWSKDDPRGTGESGDGKSVDTRPSIFTALQETLGLKLEGRKIPVEILVVDHVERTPTEN